MNSDFDQVEAAAKAKEAADRDLAADVEVLMKSAHGRRMVWRLLSRSGVWRSSFNADVAVMAFNEGRRDTGLWLLDMVLRFAADEYALLEKEAREWVKKPKKRC